MHETKMAKSNNEYTVIVFFWGEVSFFPIWTYPYNEITAPTSFFFINVKILFLQTHLAETETSLHSSPRQPHRNQTIRNICTRKPKPVLRVRPKAVSTNRTAPKYWNLGVS